MPCVAISLVAHVLVKSQLNSNHQNCFVAHCLGQVPVAWEAPVKLHLLQRICLQGASGCCSAQFVLSSSALAKLGGACTQLRVLPQAVHASQHVYSALELPHCNSGECPLQSYGLDALFVAIVSS